MDLFDLCVRLKVCEGCGCLWYRYEIELNVYCHLCADRLKEFPTVKSRKQRGRPRKAILPTVFAVEDPQVCARDPRNLALQCHRISPDRPAQPQALQGHGFRRKGTGFTPHIFQPRQWPTSPEVPNERRPPTPLPLGRPARQAARIRHPPHPKTPGPKSRARPTTRPPRLLRLLPPPHRKPAKTLPLRLHAGRPLAQHPQRLGRPGLGHQLQSPYL